MNTDTSAKIVKILGENSSCSVRFTLGLMSITELEERLECATTPRDCYKVYIYSPKGSDIRQKILDKIILTTKTIKECECLYNSQGTDIKRMARKKLNELLQLKLVTIAKEGRGDWFGYSEYSEISDHPLANTKTKQKAKEMVDKLMRRELKTAKTVGECEDVSSGCIDPRIKLKARKKVKKLLMQRLKVATSTEEYWEIYEDSPDYCDYIERESLKKALLKASMKELYDMLLDLDEGSNSTWLQKKIANRAIDVARTAKECSDILMDKNYGLIDGGSQMCRVIRKMARIIERKEVK